MAGFTRFSSSLTPVAATNRKTNPQFSISYVVLAGGAGGGGYWGGGGGAGGYQFVSAFTITPGSTYTITIGAGGTGGTGGATGSNGSPTIFDTVTSAGGGGGGARVGGENFPSALGPPRNGYGGGSGGGAGSKSAIYGRGIYPGSTHISAARQGYDGGPGQSDNATYDYGGGGGGAGGAGAALSAGVGVLNPITGSTVGQLVTGSYWIGGGGGAGGTASSAGGKGGGGAGGAPATPGTANTGAGGGGGTGFTGPGGTGGSGVVILTYPATNPDLKSIGAGLTYAKTTSGANTIYTFTVGTGTISW